MYRIFVTCFILILLVLTARPVHAYTLRQSKSGSYKKWPTKTKVINISLSSSLFKSPNIKYKDARDIERSVRQALDVWATASGIKFNIGYTDLQSVSADGVNIITIASTRENRKPFEKNEVYGYTRIFCNAEDKIIEGDITLNPNFTFSATGSKDDCNLTGVLTHEIGHLLGLDHSDVKGATMRPNSANGPASETMCTLSADDETAIRSLYAPANTGSINGNLEILEDDAYSAEWVIWAIDSNGAVAASTRTDKNYYDLRGLLPGSYKIQAEPLRTEALFLSEEFRGMVNLGEVLVTAGESTNLDAKISGTATSLIPVAFGLDFRLTSNTAIPVNKAGGVYTFSIGVIGLPKDIKELSITSSSPLLEVDKTSIAQQSFILYNGNIVRVVHFHLIARPNISEGEYNLYLTSNGVSTCILGAITVEDPQRQQISSISRGFQTPPASFFFSSIGSSQFSSYTSIPMPISFKNLGRSSDMSYEDLCIPNKKTKSPQHTFHASLR
jgi:hypothetical protein